VSEAWYSRRFRAIYEQIAQAFLELLFPPQCHICGVITPAGGKSLICVACLDQLSLVKPPLCCRCGCQFDASVKSGDHYCQNCLKNVPLFDTACSLLRYQSPVPEILHRLKYQADSSVFGVLRQIIEHDTGSWSRQECDLVIPVPLHVRKLRRRGFNQSHLLARLVFSDYQEKIAVNLLVRSKNTTSQTGLSGIERRQNLRNAFQVTAPKEVKGKTIWLVDDVFTTGTTVSECSKILRKNGADRIHVWTFARV
jgi:ComF family protein